MIGNTTNIQAYRIFFLSISFFYCKGWGRLGGSDVFKSCEIFLKFEGSSCSLYSTLSLGQGFKPQRCQAAPLRDLNTL